MAGPPARRLACTWWGSRVAVASGEPLPAVLPVVLYNGARPWRAAREMHELIATVGPDPAQYQPAQRHDVVDGHHLAEDDLPGDNLVRSLVDLERSGSAADLARGVEALQAKLSDPHDPAAGAARRGGRVDRAGRQRRRADRAADAARRGTRHTPNARSTRRAGPPSSAPLVCGWPVR